jgi:hypothetical protein
MAATFQVGVNGNTVTVVITAMAGAGYNPASASVQLRTDASGALVGATTDVLSGGGLTRTLTYNPVPRGGYTAVIACGGEVGVSSVTSGEGKLTIP